MGWRALAVVGTFVFAAGGGGDAIKKELKRFEGAWKIAQMQVDGVEIPLTAFKKTTVVIDGDRMTFKDGDKVYDAIECDIDPSKKPPEIDLHHISGLKKGVVERGIYDLDGDTLKVCQSLTAKKRPSGFNADKGSAQQLMILRKQRS